MTPEVLSQKYLQWQVLAIGAPCGIRMFQSVPNVEAGGLGRCQISPRMNKVVWDGVYVMTFRMLNIGDRDRCLSLI